MALSRGIRRSGFALLLVILVGVVAAATWLPRDDREVEPEAARAWGDQFVSLPADVGAEVEGLCREAFAEAGREVPEQYGALAAQRRDGRVIALHRADGYGVCWLSEADGLDVLGASTGPTLPPPGEHVVPIALYADEAAAAGALAVSFDVRRVTVAVAGEELDAAVADGFAVFWLSDPMTEGLVAGATGDLVVTAYDEHGTQLARVSPF